MISYISASEAVVALSRTYVHSSSVGHSSRLLHTPLLPQIERSLQAASYIAPRENKPSASSFRRMAEYFQGMRSTQKDAFDRVYREKGARWLLATQCLRSALMAGYEIFMGGDSIRHALELSWPTSMNVGAVQFLSSVSPTCARAEKFSETSSGKILGYLKIFDQRKSTQILEDLHLSQGGLYTILKRMCAHRWIRERSHTKAHHGEHRSYGITPKGIEVLAYGPTIKSKNELSILEVLQKYPHLVTSEIYKKLRKPPNHIELHRMEEEGWIRKHPVPYQKKSGKQPTAYEITEMGRIMILLVQTHQFPEVL